MSYLAVIEGHARFDGASSLRTWFFAVIRNSARSRWRLARYGSKRLLRLALFMPLEAEASADDSPHTDYERAESADRIVAAWRALPPRQREVLDLVDGPDDVGGGGMIPTISSDQYAATLARWFGVPDSQLAAVAPNIDRFSERDLGFMS